MSELPEVLERKVGPWPLGLWVIFGATGIAAGMWLRNRNGTDVPTPAGSSSGGIVPGYETIGAPITPATDDGLETAWTDALWLAQGVAMLTGQGVLPTDAYRALSRFLNEDTLTASDVALVNRVIASLGTPPDGPRSVTMSPSAPGVSSQPRQQSTVIVRWVAGVGSRGETPSEVAARINAYGWRLRAPGGPAGGQLFTGDAIRYMNRISTSNTTPLRPTRVLKLGPAR